MCIFSGTVVHVAKTKIFVAVTHLCQLIQQNGQLYQQPYGNPLQLTVYENEVGAKAGAAMILPFPLVGDGYVAFADFSRYPDFFSQLDALFPRPEQAYYKSRGSLTLTNEGAPMLAVHEVGSYKASIVPSLADFARLRNDVFHLEPDTAQVLKQHYSQDFGFMVCILDPSKDKYHPFAYVHNYGGRGLFVPTRHYHPGTAAAAVPPLDTAGLDFEDRFLAAELASGGQSDWDHAIYVLNDPRLLQSRELHSEGISVEEADAYLMRDFYKYIDIHKLPQHLSLGSVKQLHKISIDGNYHGNHDFLL